MTQFFKVLHSLMVFCTNRTAWSWKIGIFCADREQQVDTTDHLVHGGGGGGVMIYAWLFQVCYRQVEMKEA